MHKEFWNLEHAQQYLSGCYVKFLDSLVYVRDVALHGDRLEVVFRSPTTDVQTEFLDHESWDFNVGDLGYVNYEGMALHIGRIPRRMWKVGLCARNVYVQDLHGDNVPLDGFSLLNEGVANQVVANKYPVPAVCRAKLSKKREPHIWPNEIHSFAFSSRFAMADNGDVFTPLIGKPIGMWSVDPLDPDHRRVAISLLNDYQYLQQALMEDLR